MTYRLMPLIAMLLFIASTVVGQTNFPQPRGLVNDFANKLNSDTEQLLENQLRDFRASHGFEMVVVTIPFDYLQNSSIEKYTRELGQTWKDHFGHKNLQFVLLVAIKNRNSDGTYSGGTRLEVSRALEKAMPNDLAKELIAGMREDFKAGRFDDALTTGVENILNSLANHDGAQNPGQTGNNLSNSNPNQTSALQSRTTIKPNNPSPKNGWTFSNVLIFIIGLPIFIASLITMIFIRVISKSTRFGTNANNLTRQHFFAADRHISSTDYQSNTSSWNDTNTFSGASDSPSSSFNDSTNTSSWNDSGSMSSSDSSSSSSSDFGGGGSTDSW